MPKINTIANRFAALGVSLEGLATKFDVWDAIGRSGAFTHPDLIISAADLLVVEDFLLRLQACSTICVPSRARTVVYLGLPCERVVHMDPLGATG